MSYLGTREDAIRDSKAVAKFDDSHEPTSPQYAGGTIDSDGGLHAGAKVEEFKPKSYVLHDSQKTMRRKYK